jgi:hypothetical protein
LFAGFSAAFAGTWEASNTANKDITNLLMMRIRISLIYGDLDL